MTKEEHLAYLKLIDQLGRTIAELREYVEKAAPGLKDDVGIVTSVPIIFGKDHQPYSGWVYVPGNNFDIGHEIYVSFSKDPHVALPGRLVASVVAGIGLTIEVDGIDMAAEFWICTNAEPGDTITITRGDGK